MVWETVFMLLVLKIPVVYLALVVWWAIRAKPTPEEPAALVPAEPSPDIGGPPRWRPSRGSRRFGPRPSGPSRRPTGGRAAAARAEVRK